jgi:hypothetical protein
MSKIAAKIYRLKEFPVNSKVTCNQSDEIKRILIDDSKSFKKIVKEIETAYSISLENNNGLKLFWKDEDDELITLSNDQEFKTAFDFYSSNSKTIKIYIVDSTYQRNVWPFQELNQFKTQTSRQQQKQPQIPANASNYACDECKSVIAGSRYLCKQCNDYDLCEACNKKGIHTEHAPLIPIPSPYGFAICDECEKEIKTNYNSCKNCLNEKVPKLNEKIKNKTFRYFNYLVCDDCKLKNHSEHEFQIVSANDLAESNKKLLNEVKDKLKKGNEIKSHYGINCSECVKTCVSFRSTTFTLEYIFLCLDCFNKGMYQNTLSFVLVTNEDADKERKRRHQLQVDEFNKRISQNQKLIKNRKSQIKL